MNLIKLHRIGHFFHKKGIPVLPRLFRFLVFLIYNSDIPASVVIGRGTVFGHSGIGVVIHQEAIIGEKCTIGQGITIGGRSKNPPNAVVLKDVKDNTIVGGIPAKVLKEDINIEDFI